MYTVLPTKLTTQFNILDNTTSIVNSLQIVLLCKQL